MSVIQSVRENNPTRSRFTEPIRNNLGSVMHSHPPHKIFPLQNFTDFFLQAVSRSRFIKTIRTRRELNRLESVQSPTSHLPFHYLSNNFQLVTVNYYEDHCTQTIHVSPPLYKQPPTCVQHSSSQQRIKLRLSREQL